MKKEKMRMKTRLVWLLVSLYVFGAGFIAQAQQIRWLHVGDLQAPFSALGVEFEGEFSTGNGNFFAWQPQYSIDQNVTRSKCMWMGCKNFTDPGDHYTIKNPKVIGASIKAHG